MSFQEVTNATTLNSKQITSTTPESHLGGAKGSLVFFSVSISFFVLFYFSLAGLALSHELKMRTTF